MATNGMHNLATLIKRLEAATARLEDIAESTQGLPPASASSPSSSSAQAPVASISANAPAPPTPVVPAEPVPESVEEFDHFVKESVMKYVDIAKEMDSQVSEQAQALLDGFRGQRDFLLISTKAKKPDMTGSEMSVFQDLVKPISESIARVGSIKESNRASKYYNHLSTVSEGALVLAWVTVDNRPWKHVEESLGSAQFFGNRVLQEFKEKDPKQVEFVQTFYQVFRHLAEYVKQYFPNGIIWNSNGKPAKEVMAEVASRQQQHPSGPAAPAAGGPPPPPPPPPPPAFLVDSAPPAPPTSTGIGAVFSELNRGEAVTKNLRKVDKSEMTHKNPSLRAGSTVPDKDSSSRGKSPAPGKKPKPESMRVKKPPKKELVGNKWIIENYDSPPDPIEIEASISHSILISKCSKTTIIVKGKGNAVTVENTNRLSLVIDSLVSTVDVVKSQNFALQVMGSIPTTMMDQVDGAQVYLSKESTGTKIFSSKSAGINLNIISGPEDDYKEVPLPSQLCSYYDAEKDDLVNEIVAHAG
ncbi:Adenylyl cyclase-associated protein [Scedosporium apiospermum]|uniref:Adenylyl cyclase-associated protein n=2 Tax=Microascaceae TaxID=5593 RepID=A0A084GGP5_PSEDA|nr:Adenylyl cyclase-associated protein [Scedosporium apiospermum]KEZ46507.1 Adenylyl cyclase-associated protein [Scedosporium apiospermum]